MTTVFSLVAAVAAPGPLTIDDYATMPTISAVQFSPDGNRIAYVVTRADLDRSVYDSDVWLINPDGTENIQLTRGPEEDRAPRWSPDGTSIAFLSDRDETDAVYVIHAKGGEARRLTDEELSVETFEWAPDGKAIAFTALEPVSEEAERRAEEKDDAWVVGEELRQAHLHLIDVASGKPRQLTRGPFSVWSFSWSPDGQRIAFDRGPGRGLDDQFRTDIHLLEVKTGKSTPLVVRTGLDRRPLFSPDGGSVAFTSTRGTHDWLREQTLQLVSIESGEIRDTGRSYGRIPNRMIWSPDSRTIWFEGPLDTTTQLFRVDAGGTNFTNVSNAAGLVRDPAIDFANRRVAFVYETLTAPPELFISPLGRFEPRRLTDHNASYRGRQLGETRLIRWKNPKDGLEIEGLLTLPVGYLSGRKYPLLTFVHGGPASRFDQGFLGYLGYIYPTHVFAARGYAVLRPNPRGTGGYGERFRQANRRDWGGMDWLDINAGIDAVIGQEIADPARLGLMGWSYGGFIASWAVGQSDRFKAISIGAPVVDLLSFHGSSDIRDFIPGYFEGTPLERLRERSPAWHLRKIAAPILIQHGAADERVPLSQGTLLYRLLQELGNDVTMVVYPRTPHTPQEPKLRIDAGRRNVEFFTRHVPRTSP